MIILPHWAVPFLNNQDCPHCKSKTEVAGVIGIGVRQKDYKVSSPSKGDFVMTFEYVCASCSKKSLWIADPNEQKLDLTAILEQIISAQGLHSGKNISKSKISDKEINDLKKALNNSKTYEDILRYLGIEIESDNDKKE